MAYVIETPAGERMMVFGLEGHEDCSVVAQCERDQPEFWTIVDGEILPDLEGFKERKRAAANAIRDAKSFGRGAQCNTTLGVVQSDENSKTKISGLALMAFMAKVGAQPFSVTFTLADNSEVILNADGMVALGKQVGAFDISVHEHCKSLKAQIDAAADLAELDVIDVTVGWPE